MITRAATLAEVPFLTAQLQNRAKDNYEQFDLRQSIVHVAEDTDGLLAGMVCARIRPGPLNMVACWHVEPLILFPEFVRTSPTHSRKKATYLLARAAESWIADRTRNTTGVQAFFVYIETKNKPMHGLAKHIGWKPVKGKLYVKET